MLNGQGMVRFSEAGGRSRLLPYVVVVVKTVAYGATQALLHLPTLVNVLLLFKDWNLRKSKYPARTDVELALNRILANVNTVVASEILTHPIVTGQHIQFFRCIASQYLYQSITVADSHLLKRKLLPGF